MAHRLLVVGVARAVGVIFTFVAAFRLARLLHLVLICARTTVRAPDLRVATRLATL